jgi:hypothetical protein
MTSKRIFVFILPHASSNSRKVQIVLVIPAAMQVYPQIDRRVNEVRSGTIDGTNVAFTLSASNKMDMGGRPPARG